MLKEKRDGYAINFRTFIGKDGGKYLVFRTAEGSFHVFSEVEAKEAARDCGSAELSNTRQMWESLWAKP